MTEEPAPAASGSPRAQPLLVVSLLVSAISVALPAAFGPLGPLAAGVLAFAGYRRVRAEPGAYRGPVLAKVAMTAALVLFCLQAWIMVRTAATAAATRQIRARIEAVDATLRTGTAEGAWDLLSAEARGGADRAAWVADLRATMGRLGPLGRLGEVREAGGDWNRTASFEDGDAADLRLPMAFDAEFRDGRALVEVEVVVRRREGVVAGELTVLRVVPLGR